MSFPREALGRTNQLQYWLCFGGNMVLTTILLFGGVFSILTGSFATGAVMLMLLLPIAICFRVIMMRRCRDIGWPVFLPWAAFVAFVVLGAVSGFPQKVLAGSGTDGALVMGAASLADFLLMIVIGCIASKPYVEAPVQDLSEPVAEKPAPVSPKPVPVIAPTPAAPARQTVAPIARKPVPVAIQKPAPIVHEEPAPAPMIGLPGIPYPDMRNTVSDEPDYDRWDAAIAARLAALKGDQPKEDDGDADQRSSVSSVVRPAAPAPSPAAQRPAAGFGRKVA